MIAVQNNKSRPEARSASLSQMTRHGGTWKEWGKGSHDRPALRADPQRLENLDHAGGTRAPLYSDPGQHPRRRPEVQAGLAIGKFVKEPFDEEARKNMFGQKAKEMAGRK